MTIARQWAWKPNDEVKSLEQCLHGLIRSAGGDGNLLFNVGPKPDGTIEPLQAQRLKEMGQWLEEYGYTIYGTRGGPFKPTDWVGHYWTPAKDDKLPWVEIDLEQPEKISKAILFESGQAVKAFEIQYLKGDSWKTVYTGNSVENGEPIELPDFTAQKVRLVLTGFSAVPGIYEVIFL
jgi:alpha-L-fucosidase